MKSREVLKGTLHTQREGRIQGEILSLVCFPLQFAKLGVELDECLATLAEWG